MQFSDEEMREMAKQKIPIAIEVRRGDEVVASYAISLRAIDQKGLADVFAAWKEGGDLYFRDLSSGVSHAEPG